MPCGRHPASHFEFGWTSVCFVLFKRQRQADHCKLEVSLVYRLSPRLAKATQTRKVCWFVLASETRSSFVAVTDLRLVSGAVAGVTDIPYSIWLQMTF